MNAIGKYKLLDEMGVGAAGTTYRASDPFRNREMVVKVLNPAITSTPELREQICRDLGATADLCHPHIIRVRDLGEVDGAIYVATEFLNGVDLRWHIERRLLSLPDKIDLMVQVAGALAFAHSRAIAHGNLKPSNIFVTDKDATILDFGIGKCLESIVEAGGRPAVLQPNYFSPEQVLGKTFNARSDVYSAALILYELLARYPFGADANVIAREIVHTTPEPLRNLDPQIPEELDQLVARALEKDPERRLARADEFAAGLYLISQRLRGGVAQPALEPVAVAPAPSTPVPAATLPAAPPPDARAAAPVQVAAAPPTVTAVPPLKAVPAESPIPARPAPAAAPQPSKQPAPAKLKQPRRRWTPYAVAAILTLCIVLVFWSRQSIRASQSKVAAPAVAVQRQNAPALEKLAAHPAPEAATTPAPAGEPATLAGEPAPAKSAEDEGLGQAKSLWASGKYALALAKVEEVLAANPENLQARLWKKKIRAAQEAEATMK